MKKKWINDYFSFTKKERMGVAALLVIILILSLLPYLFPHFTKKKTVNKKTFEKELAKLRQLQLDSSQQQQSVKRGYEENEPGYFQPVKKNYEENIKGELFVFDPNTISADEWKRLGIKDKTISTIQNYLNKGGHFYQPEDLYRIYGLKKELAERLIPYVRIEHIIRTEATESKPSYIKSKSTEDKFAPRQVEINSADTAALIALPGIGSKLSQRIVNFREKLGGFVSVAQLGETYGLPDSTFQKIKTYLSCDNSGLKKININTADHNQLKSHPYIKYSLANVIIQYKNQHGPYKSVEDLRQISFMNDTLFRKISPYLTVDK